MSEKATPYVITAWAAVSGSYRLVRVGTKKVILERWDRDAMGVSRWTENIEDDLTYILGCQIDYLNGKIMNSIRDKKEVSVE